MTKYSRQTDHKQIYFFLRSKFDLSNFKKWHRFLLKNRLLCYIFCISMMISQCRNEITVSFLCKYKLEHIMFMYGSWSILLNMVYFENKHHVLLNICFILCEDQKLMWFTSVSIRNWWNIPTSLEILP